MSSSPAKLVHFSSEYALSLLSALHDQMKTKVYCDIILIVGKCQFSAHKNILAAASPYFHAMFTGGLAESGAEEICIQGISPDVFEILLGFMYTGDIDITEDNCQDLLAAADLFQLAAILEACCLFLKQQLHPSNCLGIYQLTEAHSCEDSQRFALDYICTHFLEVVRFDEFSTLGEDTLMGFLLSEHVHIDSEIQMLVIVLDWIKHDVIKRRPSIFKLLGAIRFPLIPRSTLEKCIEDCNDLSLKIAIRKTAQDFDVHRKSVQMDKLRRTQTHLFQSRKGARRKFLIFGGVQQELGKKWNDSETLSSVEMFDVHRLTSSVITSMKYGRTTHGTAVINGLVYVIGGEKDSMIYDSVECYDPTRNEWSVVASLIEPRCGLGAAVVDDCIYAMGGWIGSKIGRTIEMYDPQTNVWTVFDEMRKPRYHMGVVAHEGLIYVLGGIGDMGQEEHLFESYYPLTKTWCYLANLSTPQTHLAVCLGDEMIYTVGGMSEEQGPVECMQSYDILRDQWRVVTRMENPRVGPALAYLDGILYVFGGRSSSIGPCHTTSNIDSYDIDADSWRQMEPLCCGRWGSTALLL